MSLGRVPLEDWPEGWIVVVPDTWRADGLWTDVQSEAQEEIDTSLREMYAEFTKQPLSPRLKWLLREIELSVEDTSA